MNIKIKATGVACLIGDDYDRVYTALKKQFGENEQTLFTERKPGHEYLQWVLPDEGWKPITEADPLMGNEIERELQRRKALVYEKFGSNQAMAQRILSVPDNSYVYYKATPNGLLDIKLTAWGYRYPERIGGSLVVGNIDNTKKRTLSLSFLDNGKGIPNMSFRLNGYTRTTDENGEYPIGDLPVGYQFDVDFDGVHQHFVVKDTDDTFVFDCTKYGTVEVKVTQDGIPAEGVGVEVVYNDSVHNLQTDSSGSASVQVALGKNGFSCKVIVNEECQEKPFGDTDTNTFVFNLVSHKDDPQPEHPKEPEPPNDAEPEHVDEVLPAPPLVEVTVFRDDVPVVGDKVSVKCGEIFGRLTTDNAGQARMDLPAECIGQMCQVEVSSAQLKAQIHDNVNPFRFDLPPIPSPKAKVEVQVNREGAPWSNEAVRVSYNNTDIPLTTDANGFASTEVDILDEKDLCRVTVEDQYQAMQLKEATTRFIFDFKTESAAAERPSLWRYIKYSLFVLLLMALVYITYCFCYGMLFG